MPEANALRRTSMPRFQSIQDVVPWLRLAYAGLPTHRTRALLAHFGAPDAVFAAAHSSAPELRSEFKITEKGVQKLRDCAIKDVGRQLDAMQEHQIGVVPEAEFPSLLRQIGDDVPPFLFIRGEFLPQDERSIAIVGTRNMTEYGRGLAHTFGVELARAGWTVASGLARGIDTAAHQGALDGGGRTLAVTGCGLDIVYPSENRELMTRIESSGAVLSEWAPTTPPEAWHFPARNRIIVGLSRAIIVVEAKQKSGALITATIAANHDRTVFAVPGNIHKPQSRGPHQLIKEGAVLLESIEDALEYLGSAVETLDFDEENEPEALPSVSIRTPSGVANTAPASDLRLTRPATVPQRDETMPPSNLAPQELRLYLLLEADPRHLDDLAEAASLDAGPTNAALVMLELKGFARRLPGNLFVKSGKTA